MASAKNWVIDVRSNADGARKVVYSWQAGTVQLNLVSATATVANIADIEFHNTPNGDSLDATWKGDHNGGLLDIEALDLIVIYTLGYRAGETASTYYERWRGYASLPANPNHSDGEMHQYRALGLSRLLELVDTGDNFPITFFGDIAKDVASLVLENAQDNLPLGVSFSQDPFAIIGVTNTAQINPGSVGLAEVFDKLAALCRMGAVEAVWGVRPDGKVFFEPRSTEVVAVDESAPGTVLQWREPQADTPVNAVRWMVADGSVTESFYTGDGVSLLTPDTLSYWTPRFGAGFAKHTAHLLPPEGISPFRVIPATYSLESGVPIASFVGDQQDSTFTLDNVGDNDPTSYAVVEEELRAADSAPQMVKLRAALPTGIRLREIVMVSLDFKLDDSSPQPGEGEFELVTYYVLFDNGPLEFQNSIILQNALRQTPAVKTVLVQGDRARLSAGPTLTATGNFVDLALGYTAGKTGYAALRFAVQDFRIYQLDTTALDALAEQEFQLPVSGAFEAWLPGQVAPGGLAAVTKLDGSTLSGLPVTATGTRISGADGTQTHIVVGPRTKPALSEEFNRIKRRDSQAALLGARAFRR